MSKYVRDLERHQRTVHAALVDDGVANVWIEEGGVFLSGVLISLAAAKKFAVILKNVTTEKSDE